MPPDMTTTTGPHHAIERTARISQVLWGILGLNLIVAIAKLIYGYHSGALAITADGIHSLLDASSNVVGLVGIAAARRPPDANHPYGHRKYETVAALGIVAMLFLGCREIAGAAIERLRAPHLPHVTIAGFVILFVTLGINLLVVWFERREGRRLQSELLLSDAAHTGSDVLASVLVIVSFAARRAVRAGRNSSALRSPSYRWQCISAHKHALGERSLFGYLLSAVARASRIFKRGDEMTGAHLWVMACRS